ncbi:glycosyltransferase [Mangrovimonas sp. TPBH4]|uniref:glycosyltransferase n=1 Tax=Mangrovimonas sp. TPBH4 TaxID=1645914 RepID=UPI0006B50F13|nr:glycosyltransferase [Mangrovimonas sp. TPBH4]
MISIIIPSRNPKALSAISANIKGTIGVPYEIISYDNTRDGYGICKIYNLCAEKAQYENLVFCHDDIVFHTDDWGQSLMNLLQLKQIGLVGVCGATYKSKYPAPWVSIPKSYYCSSLFKTGGERLDIGQESFEKVAVVDGCFLSMRKDIWKAFEFNETELQGFHIYDIDISLQIGKNYDVVVERMFEIEHLSEGVFDQVWYMDSDTYHKKNRALLPVSTSENFDFNYLDGYALKSLIGRSVNLKLKRSKRISLLVQLIKNYPTHFNLRMLKILR